MSLKVTEYPYFKNPRVNSPEEELTLLLKLIWLSSKQFVAFGSYNGTTWDDGVYPFLIANDTFYYACADGEGFEEKDLDTIIDAVHLFGWDGIAAWMSLKRNQEVIPELVNDKYKSAKEYLQGKLLVSREPLDLFFDSKAPIASIEDRITFLYKLIWLAQQDVVSFATPEEWGCDRRTGIHCFDNIYAYSHNAPIDEKDIKLLIDLYDRFSYHGLDAWQVMVDKDWRNFVNSLEKPAAEEYLAAIDYLERLNK